MSAKHAYEKRLEAQLDEWNEKIYMLKSKVDKVGVLTRLTYQNTLVTLERKRDEVKNKLADIKKAENTWEDIKTAAEQIASEVEFLLEEAIKSMRSIK